MPWALEVLREQFSALQALVGRSSEAHAEGAADALMEDLLRAVDRHLRLEHEIFHPALESAGVDTHAARASHAALQTVLDGTARRPADRVRTLAELGNAIDTHRKVQEQALFPCASRLPEPEMAALGLELDEARQRMNGAYGV